MTTAANYRSIFTNNNVDDSKGLYEPTKLIATNGGSGSNLPIIFVNLVGDDSLTAPTATIIQEAPTIDQIDASNDNIITKAVDAYIKHLGTGDFNKIPVSSETYRDTINPLINLINQGTDSVVQYILDATMAAAKVREMFDDSFRLNTQLAQERQKYTELEQGLNLDTVFGCISEENIGGLHLNMEINLTPLMLKYIELYGVPLAGQSVDSIKLTQIKEDMIAQGIDPYGRDSSSDTDSESPLINKSGPFAVNGYYPLYPNENDAINASPIINASSFILNNQEFWMPDSVDQFLGDFDEWNTFRENDNYDGIIKTWNNDITEGVESTFVAELTNPMVISISFDILG